MAQSDVLRRYLDEGVRVTQLTQSRAEAIVNRLVKAGELQADQAQSAVQELVDRSRKSTERLLGVIRREVVAQVGSLGLATKADVARLERRIDALARAAGTTGAAKRPTKAAAAGATKSTAKPASPTRARSSKASGTTKKAASTRTRSSASRSSAS